MYKIPNKDEFKYIVKHYLNFNYLPEQSLMHQLIQVSSVLKGLTDQV